MGSLLKTIGLVLLLLLVFFQFQSCLEWQKIINYRNNYEEMVKQTVKDMVKEEALKHE